MAKALGVQQIVVIGSIYTTHDLIATQKDIKIARKVTAGKTRKEHSPPSIDVDFDSAAR